MTRYALFSVTDKTHVVEFARGLATLGYSLLSTGGTAKVLRDAGLTVLDVSAYTQSPEIMDGRVKTLHPKIYAGILCDRQEPIHRAQLEDAGAAPIDFVIVNLYEFQKEAVAKGLSLDASIEHIDIGGPSMLRAAAKNHADCLPVMDPKDYERILAELRADGALSLDTRRQLAAKVFQTISAYDQAIATYFTNRQKADVQAEIPKTMQNQFELRQALRYGENPQQKAALYRTTGESGGLLDATILQGKELSYNNYLDLDATLALTSELSGATTVVIVKHTNPCGAASFNGSLSEVYQRALASDPVSAFGGIVATNTDVDEETARLMSELFLECIAAPGFSVGAQKILGAKKNLRLLTVDVSTYKNASPIQLRSLNHGILAQTFDVMVPPTRLWTSVTKAQRDQARNDLFFAMTVAKHVKSNAIVLAKDCATLGVGAGQMSRVDALDVSIKKAKLFKHDLKGAVLASDAFFPFRDCVDIASKEGIAAIVQPGGSVKDQDSIDACNEAGIAMLFTGQRHFKH